MKFMKAYHEWRRYRDTVNELESLSNRELCDLGISRFDIHNIAKQTKIR